MFKWFRERRRDIKFTHCFREAAQQKFDDGMISYQKLEQCLQGADDPKIMRKARLQLTASDGRLGGIADWDWEAIWQWFQDYFIPAMRVIIPLVIMLLEPNPTEDE